MSAQLLKLQTWAPTECAECCSGLLASRKEENLTSFEKRKKVGHRGVFKFFSYTESLTGIWSITKFLH